MPTFKTSKAKEQILARIRKGLNAESVSMPFPEADKGTIKEHYQPGDLSLEEQFATEFIKLGGKFVFCDNEHELLDHIHTLCDDRGWTEMICADARLLNDFQNNKLDFIHKADATNTTADASITICEALVARTGSALLSSKQNLGRISTAFYPVHIIVAYTGQVVPDIQDALNLMQKKYGKDLPSMINLNTGPSRTADIEKTLVVGVHGPKEVFCFFVNV